VTFLHFSAPPAVIKHPGNCAPLDPTRYDPVYQEKVVHEEKDKKCLRNTNILNYVQSFESSRNFWLNTNIYEIFDQMARLRINLVRR